MWRILVSLFGTSQLSSHQPNQKFLVPHQPRRPSLEKCSPLHNKTKQIPEVKKPPPPLLPLRGRRRGSSEMPPRPTSDELWGTPTMPSPCGFDILMPNGTVMAMSLTRDVTLSAIKIDLWKEAKKEIMYRFLEDPSCYVFVGVTQDAKMEEFYDESRRVCDLRLCFPVLKLVPPNDDPEEMKLESVISVAVGKNVHDFDSCKDPEFVDCRRSLLYLSNQVVKERNSMSPEERIQYFFPVDLVSFTNDDLKKTEEKPLPATIFDGKTFAHYNLNLQPFEETPNQVIERLQKEGWRDGSLIGDEVVLKIVGFDEYLLGNYKLCEYKYISQLISQGKKIDLVIVYRNDLLRAIPPDDFLSCTFYRRNADQHMNQQIEQQHLQENLSRKKITNLWITNRNFRIAVNIATYTNVKDFGLESETFVRVGIYHGLEALCSDKETGRVPPQVPKWNEWLEFDQITLDALPRGARLCLSMCSESLTKKSHPVAIAYANIPIFDYKDRLLTGKMKIHLWRVPKEHTGLLFPLGVTGVNPEKHALGLEIEFDKHPGHGPIIFPPDNLIDEHCRRLLEVGNRNEEERRKKMESMSGEERARLIEILSRDPLSSLSEEEKDFLFRLRKFCSQDFPDSLPKLLQAVRWSNRDEVAEIYFLLKKWKSVKIETSLELLDCKFTDLKVRLFAINNLDKSLPDHLLKQYLLQLVEVVLHEPYLNNDLVRFLLRRSLKNRHVGHYFFWLLRAEMHDLLNSKEICGLILEAYCRGVGMEVLQSITKQVEAMERLVRVTDDLKEKKDHAIERREAFLRESFRQSDYVDFLTSLPNPLSPSSSLGQLITEECRIMDSAKRPLWLVWENGDATAKLSTNKTLHSHQIIFKSGDDLRQDMLTLQVIAIMDNIWRSAGLDLKMLPYTCLATGKNVGLIQVVRDAQTVMRVQKSLGWMAAYQLGTSELYKWLDSISEGDSSRYEQMMDTFMKSCAGYSVATFVLGIGDRNPDNIMINTDGQIFHIDFGHFLGHFKKKYGINRERVPFVLIADFVYILCRGNLSETNPHFLTFMKCCEDAYLMLREHANLLVTLFTLMLNTGIPELQTPDDIEYLRTTLQLGKSQEEALHYFRSQIRVAKDGSTYTKIDWLFHSVRRL